MIKLVNLIKTCQSLLSFLWIHNCIKSCGMVLSLQKTVDVCFSTDQYTTELTRDHWLCTESITPSLPNGKLHVQWTYHLRPLVYILSTTTIACPATWTSVTFFFTPVMYVLTLIKSWLPSEQEWRAGLNKFNGPGSEKVLVGPVNFWWNLCVQLWRLKVKVEAGSNEGSEA